MDLTEELKECILGECEAQGKAKLASVMARLDCQQHAIFSLSELENAIAQIGNIQVVKSGKEIELVLSKNVASNVALTEQDIQNTYNLYTAMLKQ